MGNPIGKFLHSDDRWANFYELRCYHIVSGVEFVDVQLSDGSWMGVEAKDVFLSFAR